MWTLPSSGDPGHWVEPQSLCPSKWLAVILSEPGAQFFVKFPITALCNFRHIPQGIFSSPKLLTIKGKRTNRIKAHLSSLVMNSNNVHEAQKQVLRE
jgi:hypothetical protein